MTTPKPVRCINRTAGNPESDSSANVRHVRFKHQSAQVGEKRRITTARIFKGKWVDRPGIDHFAGGTTNYGPSGSVLFSLHSVPHTKSVAHPHFVRL